MKITRIMIPIVCAAMTSLVGCDQNEPKRTARDDLVDITQRTKPQLQPVAPVSIVKTGSRATLVKDK